MEAILLKKDMEGISVVGQNVSFLFPSVELLLLSPICLLYLVILKGQPINTIKGELKASSVSRDTLPEENKTNVTAVVLRTCREFLARDKMFK